ncbi:uncharacterized protein ASCRUDRAFT_82446 [Ascoidea rubescens DSM 1968]|uniref:NAD(P)-binding domain-containing protein n=1 Tax=Ascoidea rubescens DSM 1968 TaxID=1344418 RepID=A0A1D2VB01_9ASCO|nr:hypothetical protein ASCRUDRAFT_82446 [Ascoidea rubescens DSM 1968]ODV58781.1 hypothetical protein ASCRUDRAFT_82446 [Ascoidea rubescens DSM 1968]
MVSVKAFIIGATGLVGNGFYKEADKSKVFSNIFTLTRRDLLTKSYSNKTTSIIEKNSENWDSIIKDTITKEKIDIFFSGLATTKKEANGFDNQYKIDHDLNLQLAKVAKESGVGTYILISSMGANKDSSLSYLKMKGKLDDEVIDLKFPRTIIIRPGVLVGQRDKGKDKGLFNNVVLFIGEKVHGTFLNNLMYPIYDYEIGKIVVDLIEKTPIPADDEPEVTILNPTQLSEILKNIESNR